MAWSCPKPTPYSHPTPGAYRLNFNDAGDACAYGSSQTLRVASFPDGEILNVRTWSSSAPASELPPNRDGVAYASDGRVYYMGYDSSDSTGINVWDPVANTVGRFFDFPEGTTSFPASALVYNHVDGHLYVASWYVITSPYGYGEVWRVDLGGNGTCLIGSAAHSGAATDTNFEVHGPIAVTQDGSVWVNSNDGGILHYRQDVGAAVIPTESGGFNHIGPIPGGIVARFSFDETDVVENFIDAETLTLTPIVATCSAEATTKLEQMYDGTHRPLGPTGSWEYLYLTGGLLWGWWAAPLDVPPLALPGVKVPYPRLQAS